MQNKGFTLIELLIVVGVLAILVGAVIVAINPLEQFSTTNNARRWADVTNMMNAISQNVVDNKGVFSTTSPNCGGDLPTSTTAINSTTGYDLCGCVVPSYIGSLPVDPAAGTPAGGVLDCTAAYDTGYNIVYSTTTRRVTISAPNAQMEDGSIPTISLTR